jgi:hypothetical protein
VRVRGKNFKRVFSLPKAGCLAAREQINVLDKEVRQARILWNSRLLPEVSVKWRNVIKSYMGGIILACFSKSGEFYQWTETELSQKNPGLKTRRLSGEIGTELSRYWLGVGGASRACVAASFPSNFIPKNASF